MKINETPAPLSFQYKSRLKTLYLKDQLPEVVYGFYGDKLTKNNVSLEHLKPHSKGGNSSLKNFALASKRTNQLRGNEDIRKYADKDTVLQYLEQFIGIKREGFDGNKYINGVLETLAKLGLKF